MKEAKIVRIVTTVDSQKVKQVKGHGLMKSIEVWESPEVDAEINAYLKEGYRIVNIQTNIGSMPTYFYVYLERDI